MATSEWRILSYAALIAGASTLASHAWAGSESGLYLGGGVGSATLEDDVSNLNLQLDESDAGYKIIAGYNFGLVPFLNIAVEGGFVDFGNPQGTVANQNLSVEISGYDAFGLVGIALGPISLFAKAGFIAWDSDVTVASSPASDSGTDPAYGVGAQFKLLSVALRGEYEEFSLSDVDKLNLFSASLTYTF